ncbi:MAG: LysM peptidoglycan-binding domain-containing protein, partial [Marinobacter sp.]|nr:LysM peptidoglycan-binding domain-containing protein [Marinobacter sp.]
MTPGSYGKRVIRAVIPALMTLVFAVPVHAELSVTRGSTASTNTPQQSTSVPEWLYTLRPGESFSEVAGALLNRNVRPEQVLRYNGIGNGAAIGEGDALRIPLTWLKRQPDPARVVAVSGQVQHISGNSGRKQ